MSSSSQRKWQYLRDRAVNAWWMLKEGNFKLIFQSIVQEVKCRIEGLKYSLYRFRFLDDNKVRDSAFPNPCKTVPRSYRPTVSRPQDKPALTVDRQAVLEYLDEAVTTQKIHENRSSLWRW